MSCPCRCAQNLAKYKKIQEFANSHGIDFYPAGRGIGHQVCSLSASRSIMLLHTFLKGTACTGNRLDRVAGEMPDSGALMNGAAHPGHVRGRLRAAVHDGGRE